MRQFFPWVRSEQQPTTQFAEPSPLSCLTPHPRPQVHDALSTARLDFAGPSSLGVVGPQRPTWSFSARTVRMNADTLKACRLINSGGSALPIISATANLPFSREKKYRRGKL